MVYRHRRAVFDTRRVPFAEMKMRRPAIQIALLALAACSNAPAPPPIDTTTATTDSTGRTPGATARLVDLTGAEVGTVHLIDRDGRVSLEGSLRGLPAGSHGIHLHEAGRCEPPFESAGAHWNPGDRKHGTENSAGPHHGDLPNLDVASDGAVTINFVTAEGSLAGLLDFDGAAVVIHAGPDDMRTDPAGNSGDRIACGMVMR